MWFYEPPKNCREIPSDAVGEWYLDASRTCLLPPTNPKDYGKRFVVSAVSDTDSDANESDDEKMVETLKAKMRNLNIGSTTARVSALTLAFHVRSRDEIKCFLCFNGEIIRFLAQDIKEVLPRLFNMEFLGNERFAQGEQIDTFVKQIDERLIDAPFETFKCRS